MNTTAAWIIITIARTLVWDNHTTSGTYVFQDFDQMAAIWTRDGAKADHMPGVSFSKETVIAVFAGQKNGTRNKCKIEKVGFNPVTRKTMVLYRITDQQPDPKDTRLTYPAHIAVVPKIDGEVSFYDIETTDGQRMDKLLENAEEYKTVPPPQQAAPAPQPAPQK